MNKRIRHILLAALWISPFIIGTIGYRLEGYDLAGAMYGALGMYFISGIFAERNVWVDVARWLAFAATAAGLFIAVQKIFREVENRLLCLKSEATAIYCAKEDRDLLLRNMKDSFWESDSVKKSAKHQIFFLPDDMENLNLYYRYKERLEGCRVYIRLEEINSFLLQKSDVRYFSVNEMTARSYWHDHPVLKRPEEKRLQMKIGLVGFGRLGQQLLSYGLLNNIYEKNQKIDYYIWGEPDWKEDLYTQTKWQAEDKVIFRGPDWSRDLALIKSLDRLIVAEEGQLALLEAVLSTCPELEIHYYSREGAIQGELMASRHLTAFGNESEVLTEENIKGDHLYRLAKRLNDQYALQYGGAEAAVGGPEERMERSWQELDGFTKGSNIAAADYHWIRRQIMKQQGLTAGALADPKVQEELSELEHIRWCRYHWLNHWQYGIPESGKAKDKEKRIHSCLVPYEQLSREDQLKDWENIKLLFALEPLEA